LLALPLFIGMGVREFSMNPAKIFDVCRLVNRVDSQAARNLTDAIMAGLSTTSVKRKLESYAATLEKQ
jgi:phosphoenolpyruvate-protein kinase (PTS system EI component)